MGPSGTDVLKRSMEGWGEGPPTSTLSVDGEMIRQLGVFCWWTS